MISKKFFYTYKDPYRCVGGVLTSLMDKELINSIKDKVPYKKKCTKKQKKKEEKHTNKNTVNKTNSIRFK